MINRRIGLAASALVFLLSACNNQQSQSAGGERPAAATAEATEQLLEQLAAAKTGDVISIPAGVYSLDRSLSLAAPTHDVRSWNYAGVYPDGLDPVLKIPRLQDAYFARIPDYPRGITVPAMAEIVSGKVVTNDFDQMTIDFIREWGPYQRAGAPDLYPDELVDEIESVNELIYPKINNGVYKCGFAGSQEAYDKAYRELWEALDLVTGRLSERRYLVSDHLTLADIRLFTTLVRFDPVYHGHFKCNRSKITEIPVLWGYLRDLFQTPGFGDTVDFVQIKQHYYIVHTDLNPLQIVPKGPDESGWLTEHGREALGGSPFGEGTPPGPVRPDERAPHTSLPA